MTAQNPAPIDLTRWRYGFVHVRSFTCRSGAMRGAAIAYGVVRRAPMGVRISVSIAADQTDLRVTVRGLGPARSQCVDRAVALAQSVFDSLGDLELADICADLPASAYRTREATLRALESRIVDQPVTREMIPYS